MGGFRLLLVMWWWGLWVALGDGAGDVMGSPQGVVGRAWGLGSGGLRPSFYDPRGEDVGGEVRRVRCVVCGGWVSRYNGRDRCWSHG